MQTYGCVCVCVYVPRGVLVLEMCKRWSYAVNNTNNNQIKLKTIELGTEDKKIIHFRSYAHYHLISNAGQRMKGKSKAWRTEKDREGVRERESTEREI